MKRTFVVLPCVLAFFVSAQPRNEAKDAIRNGAEAKYVYQIVDDEGLPVPNATAHVWFKSYGRPQDNADWIVHTDTNGMFMVEHRVNERFSVGVDKDGYYHSDDDIFYMGMPSPLPVKDGKWLPYGEKRKLVLKKIVNPQKMNGTEIKRYHKYPDFGKWCGFDLELGDWTPPYGNGKVADVNLRFTDKVGQKGTCRVMDVSFAETPQAGAYIENCDEYSELKTSYQANTNGIYQTSFSFKYEREGRRRYNGELSKKQYMVFRVRTKVDRNGNLVSAHYGRMLGDWRFCEKGGMAIGRVAVNPIPNDPNLEDADCARMSRLWLKKRQEYIPVKEKK